MLRTELIAGARRGPETSVMTRPTPLIATDMGLKVALVALLAFGAFSGLQQFEGKAFGGRLVAYPIAVLVLPVAWRMFAHRRPFPVLADVLITAPFLIDVLGNAADLYDTVDWWDDANHFFNWLLLSAGAGLLLAGSGSEERSSGNLDTWQLALLVIGFGGTSAIVWELAEYVAFIRNSPELATAYEDTLGDLALGTLGSVVAAGIVTWSVRTRRSSLAQRG